MQWIPENGEWWRKAVLKAGGPDIYHMPLRQEDLNGELDPKVAALRLGKAIAKAEVAKCKAIMSVNRMNRTKAESPAPAMRHCLSNAD